MPRAHRMTYATATDNAPPRLNVEPLPFLPEDVEPPCAAHIDVFALAAGDATGLRATTYTARLRATRAEREAKAVCDRCPVRDGCRAYAITTGQQWGIWGATNPAERDAWWRLHGLTRGVDDVPRDKFHDVPTIPLFTADQMKQPRESRPRGPISVARGKCPKCSKALVGLVRQGRHYVWRQHFYTTWGGTARMCGASHVAACVAKETHPHGARRVRCPHEDDPNTPGPNATDDTKDAA